MRAQRREDRDAGDGDQGGQQAVLDQRDAFFTLEKTRNQRLGGFHYRLLSKEKLLLRDAGPITQPVRTRRAGIITSSPPGHPTWRSATVLNATIDRARLRARGHAIRA